MIKTRNCAKKSRTPSVKQVKLKLEVLERRILPSTLAIIGPAGETPSGLFFNDQGQVAGTGQQLSRDSKGGAILTHEDAFLWNQSTGPMLIQTNAAVLAINNNGQVLGENVTIENG